MAMEKNKVKFGLKNVHWAKITGYDEDEMPIYGEVKKLPGAVNLSLDPNGENEPFYADDGVYYVCSNNAGYEGDLEIALVTTEFATEVLGEKLDAKGVLVETSDAEMSEFALFFEFTGDKNKIRHIFHRCSASRPTTESGTVEDSKEVKTETLSLTASPLVNGVAKAKSCEKTDAVVYADWYKNPYMPDLTSSVPVSNGE